MVTPENIKEWIEKNLAESEVEVSGDGRHFDAVIVCAEFSGKSRIQQHQMVYEALQGRMGSELHALALQTSIPENEVD